MARHRRPLPAWLLGLMIALVVFALALAAFWALGYGDDPVVDGIVALGARL